MDEQKDLDVVNIDRLTAALEQGSLTEAKMKFETAGARQAREARETAAAAHEQTMAMIRLIGSFLMLFAFVGVGIYVLLLRAETTEAQRIYVSNVLTAIASGSAGYAFGKRQDKPDKE